jgi:uncharacterized protein YqeY
MISLQQIESDLVNAMKAKDQVALETLRGLKVRLQNEKIAKLKDLSEEEMVSLVKSEIKRRREAADSFKTGGRQEMADKELAEAAILEKYLPAQMSEQELVSLIDQIISENNFTVADFGKAMGLAKGKVGQTADGAAIAKMLKEKLK